MEELAIDVLEQVLVRLDVKDLIRCKGVCRSWLSFISSPRFVKAHLNHNIKTDRDNHQLGHRRIHTCDVRSETTWASCYIPSIVGSCNGLVCISPEGAQFLVTNPCTREEKKLQTLPNTFGEDEIRQLIIWGFGYDSSSDDYKVIGGFRKSTYSWRTLFHMLTLKSNTWKVIGEFEYVNMASKTGVLFDGALYWLMSSKIRRKKTIISLDLSTKELKEIPQPDGAGFSLSNLGLGVIQDRLCLYSYLFPKKWVMNNNKWELHISQGHDVAHRLSEVDDSQNTRGYVYSFSHCDGDYDGCHVPCNRDYICASIFVKSLVSPHPCVDEGPNKEDIGGSESVNTKKRKRNSL
ncbi:F-box/kelch-repeat protein At3g23880-like [Bidens hawaiensis]|uniref:F-box/kelch-repeat protein At3g23880-like n=1 Tax=Bidens hawaiensis TaxID=980011 RepID=UPI00404B4EF0